MAMLGAVSAMALLVAGVSGAEQGKGAPARAAMPRGVRQVMLDDAVRAPVVIRSSRNLLTMVELPEDVQGDMMCARCSTGKDEKPDALFRVDQVGKGRYLAITALDVGRHASSGEPVSNVVIHLEHATVMLKLVRVESTSAADMRVVLAYPNRKTESEYVRVEKAKVEAESTSRIESAVSERFLSAFAKPHHCSRKGARARNDDIVLEVTELCYFGQDVILAFTVENRGRVPVEIGKLVVNKGPVVHEYVSDRTVEFQQKSSGVVSLQLKEADRTGAFDVTVNESAGKRRSVSVGGVEF